MGFVAQWRAIAETLPGGWSDCRLRLAPARSDDTGRAARLLGPASPGRTGDEILLHVQSAQTAATERLLARLDSAGIPGSLELVAADEPVPAPSQAHEPAPAGLANAWDELAGALPESWSDLLCLVELRSSDDLGPAALALAPVNPSRHGADLAFRFRTAHRYGYGAAPEMARRCLARLDEQGIPGTVRVLEAFSDTRPLLTQGPTFEVGGRAV
jgi:hypothetical protein